MICAVTAVIPIARLASESIAKVGASAAIARQNVFKVRRTKISHLRPSFRQAARRIHGTTEPDSIGKAVSSGCIRMMNQDGIELYGRVPLGAKIVVLLARQRMPMTSCA